MTVSSLSPTLLSRSLPSSTCLLNARSSSLYRRTSASASSRPSTARFRAASAALRSCLVPWTAARVLNWLILSWTELSREWPWRVGDMRLWTETLDSRRDADVCPSCLFMRSEDTGSRGAMASGDAVRRVSCLVGLGVDGAAGREDRGVGVVEPSARVDGDSIVSARACCTLFMVLFGSLSTWYSGTLVEPLKINRPEDLEKAASRDRGLWESSSDYATMLCTLWHAEPNKQAANIVHDNVVGSKEEPRCKQWGGLSAC